MLIQAARPLLGLNVAVKSVQFHHSMRMASRLTITQMEEKLPLSMNIVNAVFIPQAQQIYSFYSNRLSRFSPFSKVWSGSEVIKELPELAKPVFTADEKLWVVGKHGRSVTDAAIFNIQKRALTEEEKKGGVSPFSIHPIAGTPKYQQRYTTSIGNSLFMFGETYIDEINDNPCNVAVFSSPEQKWLDVTPSGTAPSTRKDLGVVPIDGRRIMVFAPSQDEVMWEVFEYDTHTNTWSEVDVHFDQAKDFEIPTPGQGTAFTRLGDLVVLTGGLLYGSHRKTVDIFDLKAHATVGF